MTLLDIVRVGLERAVVGDPLPAGRASPPCGRTGPPRRPADKQRAALEPGADRAPRRDRARRAVLMDYSQMTPALALVGGAPVDLDRLQRAVGEVFDAYQPSRYAYVAGRAALVLADALRASLPA